MLALADKTGNDVRACLSMLQFHSSLKKPLRLTDVLKSNVGQKDRHKGLFGIWSAIFQVRNSTFYIYFAKFIMTSNLFRAPRRRRAQALHCERVNLERGRRRRRLRLLEPRSPLLGFGAATYPRLRALHLWWVNLRQLGLRSLAGAGAFHAHICQLDRFAAQIPNVPPVLAVNVGRDGVQFGLHFLLARDRGLDAEHVRALGVVRVLYLVEDFQEGDKLDLAPG